MFMRIRPCSRGQLEEQKKFQLIRDYKLKHRNNIAFHYPGIVPEPGSGIQLKKVDIPAYRKAYIYFRSQSYMFRGLLRRAFIGD